MEWCEKHWCTPHRAVEIDKERIPHRLSVVNLLELLTGAHNDKGSEYRTISSHRWFAKAAFQCCLHVEQDTFSLESLLSLEIIMAYYPKVKWGHCETCKFQSFLCPVCFIYFLSLKEKHPCRDCFNLEKKERNKKDRKEKKNSCMANSFHLYSLFHYPVSLLLQLLRLQDCSIIPIELMAILSGCFAWEVGVQIYSSMKIRSSWEL